MQIPGQPGQQVQLLSAAGLGQSRAQGVTLTSQAATLSTKSIITSSATTSSGKWRELHRS